MSEMAVITFLEDTARPIIIPQTSYLQKMICLMVLQLLFSVILYNVTKRTTSGAVMRFGVATAFVLCNLMSPLFFDPREHLITIIMMTFNTSWLTSFKSMLWAMGRSSLARGKTSCVQFAAILLLPLTPTADAPRKGSKGIDASDHVSPTVLALKAFIKTIIMIIVLKLLQRAEQFPEIIRSYLYAFGLYTMLSSVMDGPGAAISRFLYIKVSRHFNSPWLSTSVASFWNQRWDLSAGNALRAMVYEPILEGKLILLDNSRCTCDDGPARVNSHSTAQEINGQNDDNLDAPIGQAGNVGNNNGLKKRSTYHEGYSKQFEKEIKDDNAALAHISTSSTMRDVPGKGKVFFAVSASFLVSGCIHECIYWYLTGTFSGKRLPWLSFFALQIPLVTFERLVLKTFQRRGIQIPRVILTGYTVLIIGYTSSRLFWPPIEVSPFILQRIIVSATGIQEQVFNLLGLK